MSEILSADDVAAVLAYATGPNGCDDCQEQTVAPCDSHEALRARVATLEAALDGIREVLGIVAAHLAASDEPGAAGARSLLRHADERARAALGAVPQPARCPTCASTDPTRRDMPCSLSLYAEADVIRPDPRHREAHSG